MTGWRIGNLMPCCYNVCNRHKTISQYTISLSFIVFQFGQQYKNAEVNWSPSWFAIFPFIVCESEHSQQSPTRLPCTSQVKLTYLKNQPHHRHHKINYPAQKSLKGCIIDSIICIYLGFRISSYLTLVILRDITRFLSFS